MMNSDRSAGNGPTRQVASWIASLRYKDLPARTRDTVRLALLDSTLQGGALHPRGGEATRACAGWRGARGALLHMRLGFARLRLGTSPRPTEVGPTGRAGFHPLGDISNIFRSPLSP